jgi:hypothetical protein
MFGTFARSRFEGPATMFTGRCILLTLLLPTLMGWASVAAAQESTGEQSKPGWKKEFDVKVERIKPTDLPAPEESRFPTSLQSDAVLPAPTNLATLKATASKISPWVVEVIAVSRSATGLGSTPVVGSRPGRTGRIRSW